MTYIAAVRPYKYPYRNGIAILNEAGVFYITTASMVWARADLFCAMNFRGFGNNYNFTNSYYSNTNGICFYWILRILGTCMVGLLIHVLKY